MHKKSSEVCIKTRPPPASLQSNPRPGHQTHNCKMAYSKTFLLGTIKVAKMKIFSIVTIFCFHILLYPSILSRSYGSWYGYTQQTLTAGAIIVARKATNLLRKASLSERCTNLLKPWEPIVLWSTVYVLVSKHR